MVSGSKRIDNRCDNLYYHPKYAGFRVQLREPFEKVHSPCTNCCHGAIFSVGTKCFYTN